MYLASERSERAQSCSCSIEISDTSYVYTYMWPYVKLRICACSIVHLGSEKLRGPVVRNVGGVKFLALSKA